MSALLQISMEYDCRQKFNNFQEPQKELFRQHFPKLVERKKQDDGTEKEEVNYGYSDIIIDEVQATVLSEMLGIEFTVKKFKGVIPYQINTEHGPARYDALHIHLPNYDLHSFDQVQLIEDACTDALQEKLDEGWRILAVCPPKSQRRPDYILARRK